MIRPLRQRHRWMIPLLFVLVAVAFVSSIAFRAPQLNAPAPTSTSTGLGS